MQLGCSNVWSWKTASGELGKHRVPVPAAVLGPFAPRVGELELGNLAVAKIRMLKQLRASPPATRVLIETPP